MSFVSVSIPTAHRIWAFIYLAGESSCRSVQYIIRPHLHCHCEWMNYLLGVAPNFLAGIYVPACYTFLMPFILERKAQNRIFDALYYRSSACIFGLSGVLAWEYFQRYSQKFYFDPHDIMWTFIGVSVYWVISYWQGAIKDLKMEAQLVRGE